MSTEIRRKGLDYNGLPDKETRAFVRKCEEIYKAEERRGAESIWKMGKAIFDAKARLDHGQFQDWIAGNLSSSYASAYNFMRVYETFKSLNFQDLNIAPSALYELAKASTPEEARDFAIEYAGTGEAVTRGVAKEIITAHKSTELTIPTIPDHQDFDDSDPVDHPLDIGTESIPDDPEAPPEGWQGVIDDVEVDTAPRHDIAPEDWGSDDEAEETPPAEAPRDPAGAYVETKTETINADLPEEPRKLAPLTQAEEDALAPDAWLDTLPLRAKLRDERIPLNIFDRAALDYRALRRPLSTLRHEINRTIDGSASDDFTARMRAVAATPHPKEWKFSRENTGGFQLW